MSDPDVKYPGTGGKGPDARKPTDSGESGETQKRIRCHDVLMKYKKSESVLAGSKLKKAIRRLKSDCRDNKSFLRGELLHKLLHPGMKELQKPVPVREVWKSGMTFLSREELKPQQCLLMLICFGAHGGVHHAVIHVQGRVESCGKGKGLYPWKVEASFTELNQEALKVLGNARDYLPGV